MNYLEMLAYIYRERPSGKITLGLDRIAKLCDFLGNPQDKFRSVHVTGTNGKGSVTKFLSNLMIEHGFKTGAYYSPHLSTFKERILVNEQFVPEQLYLECFKQVQKFAEMMDQLGESSKPSFFEFTTAMAFCIFERMGVQTGAIEVGLGGRYDATNILKSDVAVIVTVDYDHMHILGDTVEKIAFEKAGIIKFSNPTVCGETKLGPLEVIQNVCKEKKSELHLIGRDFEFDKVQLKLNENKFNFRGLRNFKDLELTLNGEHQFLNASVALQAFLLFAEKLGFEVREEAVRKALKKTINPGRFEIIGDNPRYIFDGAHNTPAAATLKKTIITYLANEKLAGIVGILDDKDKTGVLSHIAPLFERLIITRPISHRAVKPEETYELAKQFNKNASFEPDPIKALEILKKEGWPTIIITGSLYLVGYLRDYILDGTLEPEWTISG
ncbi:folylpolyglutamate synthase/dihydrofolate synthase family protein [Pseudothermotoga sp.]|uniref:bifunctional folylpolyglutamate synthase/dihydrofolate synthase n=1 Tax=Pseudothermotoga sp. TaxID=2033661 RepID=UPI0031F69E3A